MNIEDKIKVIDAWEEKCAAYSFAYNLISVDSINNPPSDALYRRTKLQSILTGESFSVFNDSNKVYEMPSERVSRFPSKMVRESLMSNSKYSEQNDISQN